MPGNDPTSFNATDLYLADPTRYAPLDTSMDYQGNVNTHASILIGDKNNNNILTGGIGNDVLNGNGGSDMIFGGAGDDQIHGDGAVIVGGTVVEGNDYIDGGDGADTIWGEGGADILLGGLGNDTLYGGTGIDNLDGEEGNDTLYGGGGDDMLIGGSGDDGLNGGAGANYLDGGDGNDVIFGEGGNDYLVGDEGNDYLDGGIGTDTLYGEAGDDIIIGGAGADTLYGGTGSDIYIFNRGDGGDTVNDSKADNNIFRFGAGISSNDITLNLGSLKLNLGNGDEIHIAGFNQNDVFNSSSIDSFEFEDGTMLNTSELLARGFSLNDKIRGVANDANYKKSFGRKAA